MKKYPYPDKKPKTKKDVRTHVEELVCNTMSWLKIDGYSFFVILPGEESHVQSADSGASITLEYPYKKFKLSIQEDSLKKCLNQDSTSSFWENLEQSIFHEILHIVLWRLNEVGIKRYTSESERRDADEYTTDQLTHIIYPLVKDSRKKR